MVKSRSITQTSEWKIKAFLVKNKKSTVFTVNFRIPEHLGQVLARKDMSKDQKILLVKSFTSPLKNKDGTKQEVIPDQNAVILIMALEIGAL